MAQKILGIDIGTYSVKAIRLKSKMGGSFEYVDSFCEPIDLNDEDYANSVAAAVSKIIRENKLEADAIFAAVPAQRISGRFLQLPLTDKSKIDQVLDYEVENYMPFSSDNVITDYQLVSKDKSGSTIYAQIAQKSDITSILRIFEQAGVELKHLDSEALSLYSLLSSSFNDGKCRAILDIGHTKALLTIINKGAIAYSHPIDFGGAVINEKIKSALNVTLQKADELKKDLKMLPEVDDIINNCIKELADILKQNLATFEMFHKEPLHEILLSGGVSNIAGIDELLESLLNVRVKKMRISDIINMEKNGKSASLALAYGIALRSKNSANISKIDFKSAKTSSIKESKFVFSALIKASVMILILLSFYTVDLLIKKKSKEAALEDYQTRLLLSFNEVFPKIAARGNELATIKTKIAETNSQAEKFGALLNKGVTSLDILKEISKSIAEIESEGDVEIYECEYDGKWLNILGETGSYNLTDEIKKGLEESKFFSEVNMEYARFTTDQKRVKFSMKMALKQK